MANKAVLKCFSYGIQGGVDSIPEDVLGLFSCLITSEKQKIIEFTSEIVEAGIAGRINTNRAFNLDGYEHKIRTNTGLKLQKSAKKISYLTSAGNGDDYEESRRQGLISVDSVSAGVQMSEAFNELLEDDELRYAVETITSNREYFIINDDVDIVDLLKNAVCGLPKAVTRLRTLCEEFEIIGEQIQIILSSGVSIEKAFA